MHAIVAEPDRPLRWTEVPDPEPGPGEALVEIRATALNRADLAQRAGSYPPPPGAPETLGLECAGVVLEAPSGSRFGSGERVCALLAGGGYAERVAVPAAMLMPVPDGWSFERAAAMPEVFFTAFLNLFLEGGLERGERVLVHGGASGVGTAAIQLAASAGAEVYATAGRDDKVARCRELGAALAVNYRERDFAEAIAARVGDAGVDMILDMVGEAYVERNLALLATGGRLVWIATLSGREARLDIRTLMTKRASVRGSTLRARPLGEKVRIREAFEARFWSELAADRIAPVIDRVLPITEAEAAHAAMRRNETIGKIVLRVPEERKRPAVREGTRSAGP